MRWIAILKDRIAADLAATSGIHTGVDVVKMLLVGANVTMVCSALLKHGIFHLQNMESMKEGIGLRGYGQLDPLREYKKEGFALFESLMDRIREETLVTLSRIQLLKKKPAEEPARGKVRSMQYSHGGSAERPETVKREGKKIGRNEPCPCGSGKKYKKCCGRNE